MLFATALPARRLPRSTMAPQALRIPSIASRDGEAIRGSWPCPTSGHKGPSRSLRTKRLSTTELEIDRERVGEVSLFHSISGLYCVRALVSIAMGDLSGANNAIRSFVERSRGPCKSLDLTLGKASLLIGCTELLEAMPVPWFVDLELVRARGEEIAGELTALIKSEQIATSAEVTTLGIAHGWAGFIFALLRWARATGKNVDPILVPALDELAALAEPHGAGVRWPVHNSTDASPSYMEGWCNGTAGHTMLFAFAYDILRETRYGDLAERAAISAWTAETRLGTLCCGLGGIGYALLAAHRLQVQSCG